jgi:hypothetical protein
MKRVSISVALMVLSVFLIFAANSFAAGEGTDRPITGPSKTETGREVGQQMATPLSASDKPIMISEVLGDDLVGNRGETLGEIKDFLVSPDGEITFALISRGGVLGMGEQYAPVPWTALNRGANEDQFVANISKERFDAAPAMNKDELNSLAQSELEQRVHGYYGEGASPTLEKKEY